MNMIVSAIAIVVLVLASVGITAYAIWEDINKK